MFKNNDNKKENNKINTIMLFKLLKYGPNWLKIIITMFLILLFFSGIILYVFHIYKVFLIPDILLHLMILGGGLTPNLIYKMWNGKIKK